MNRFSPNVIPRGLTPFANSQPTARTALFDKQILDTDFNRRFSKEEKRLRRQNRQMKRSLSRRRRFKRHKATKNRQTQNIKKGSRSSYLRRQKEIDGYTKIAAPKIMSFIENPEEISEFAAKLKSLFERRIPLWIDLREVTQIDFDGISVLLAAAVRFKAKKIRFNGDMPRDRTVCGLLFDSHFFDHLSKRRFKDQDSYSLALSSSILTHAKKRVDAKLGESIIKTTSNHIWGEERRCPGLQRVLVELMQNTNNHADLIEEGSKHWWLSVRHEADGPISRFSFIDYGVGIFTNLENKRNTSKFFGALRKLKDRFQHGKNHDILELILKGELHRTASDSYFRGKGLPGIFQALSNGQISNLCIITNDAYFYSKQNIYKEIGSAFSGTFVSWEINQSNHSLP